MKTTFLALSIVLAITLGACAGPPPTPYRPLTEGRIRTGYSSEKLEDGLYRVDFFGSARTSERTARAFALFRAAELARELDMAAFTVVEGPVDRTVLDGSEKFAWLDSSKTSALGESTPQMQLTAGTIIWVPLYAPPPADLPKLVILKVRMHGVMPDDANQRTFVTEQVLSSLGPRIVRGERT